ncbi:flavin-containing monooxygenase [Actinomadura alba]|uniref:NAD(P)/FAD-dependent oxidoreductase n=1 Tax=Actinomadura alba TaxID=406431 RepID=A0ABR7LUY0_9ACTN|nr:NAD(P)/FAD-dependent oxidoreductase [Actinomadura alba]MBC6468647.1 NAD(P)/FAD-dependent oxidoreductase [Actinomadura alba]
MADDSVRHPVAVIGAGPAGLATAAALRARGVPSMVLERETELAASWRGHYDRLHLHTVRWLSHLPGYRIPRQEGPWVSRDGVIRYLERYAAHHELEVRTGVRVDRVERDDRGWTLRSPTGDVRATAVVVATGYNHSPLQPNWPGREHFTGQLLHARDYRNGGPYRGRDVLVVGAGNTGAEIAVDLAEHGASRVRLAFRTPPYILRRSQFGIPTQLTAVLLRHVPAVVADRLAEPVRKMSVPRLHHKGLPDPGPGVYSRAARGEIPVLDVGVVDAILAGRVEPVPALIGFDGAKVCLVDGTAIDPDVVVVATGYRRGLEPLVGHLGVLDGLGLPLAHGARTHHAAPHLHFLGYTNPASGMFREIAIDARRIAAALRRSLTRRTP